MTTTTRERPSNLTTPIARHANDKTSSATDADVTSGRPSRMNTVLRRARTLDRSMAETMRPHSLPVLRVLLGVVFVWFGGLKVVGASPVKALVAATIPWAAPHVVLLVLGGIEVLLGLGLLTGVAVRFVLPVLAVHLAGTFLTFVMLPGLMFRSSDPLLLTQNGEFVAKNLILISATIVLISHTHRSTPTSASAT